MNREYIEKVGIKNWYEEIDDKHSLMMSDDIDSLFTSKILQKKFNCNINMFNSFAEIGIREGVNPHTIKKNQVVGVDLDLSKNKCFANHVTYIKNDDCISLNRNIKRYNYYDKFAGSTLLTVLSLYNVNLSKMSTKQLEILISIDTAFKQYYFNKDLFEHYYRDVLEYPFFIDIVSSKRKQYFYDIIRKYKLHSKIEVEDGYLKTDIELEKLSKIFNLDLSLPTDKFLELQSFQDVGMNINKFQRTVKDEQIFSSAITSGDFVKATLKY